MPPGIYLGSYFEVLCKLTLISVVIGRWKLHIWNHHQMWCLKKALWCLFSEKLFCSCRVGHLHLDLNPVFIACQVFLLCCWHNKYQTWIFFPFLIWWLAVLRQSRPISVHLCHSEVGSLQHKRILWGKNLKKMPQMGLFLNFDVTTLSFVDTYKGVLPWNQKHLWITCLSSSLVKVVSCCLLLLHEI